MLVLPAFAPRANKRSYHWFVMIDLQRGHYETRHMATRPRWLYVAASSWVKGATFVNLHRHLANNRSLGTETFRRIVSSHNAMRQTTPRRAAT
jgi:hypothetical protein